MLKKMVWRKMQLADFELFCVQRTQNTAILTLTKKNDYYINCHVLKGIDSLLKNLK